MNTQKTFKKNMKKVLSCVLAMAVLASVLVPSALVASALDVSFTGQDSSTTTDIKVNGVASSATLTQIDFNADGDELYGTNRLINIVEADLSNTNLKFEVMNHYSSVTLTDQIKGSSFLMDNVNKYAKDDRTILAAVNGDWMHWADYQDMNHSNSSYRVGTGVQIIDGEIWYTEITAQEKTYDGPYSFGVTADNQPIVGMLKCQITLTNATTGTSVILDGLNRAPANNAIYVYNNRLNDVNGAKSDSYEIVITTDNNKFMVGQTMTGTVSAVYPANSETRPALTEGQVVVTARGTRLTEIQDKFAVGNTVTLGTVLHDPWSYNNATWQNVVNAIGGHIMILRDGDTFDSSLLGNPEDYPTNMIGYKDDGTVLMSMATADQYEVRCGLQFKDMIDFAHRVGYNTCFLLDGGGSTTMVTLDDNGTYVDRAFTNDTGVTERKVWNSLALVYDPTPSCTAQGSLDYIRQTATTTASTGVDIANIDFVRYYTSGNEENIFTAQSFDENYDGVATFAFGDITEAMALRPDMPFINFQGWYGNTYLDIMGYYVKVNGEVVSADIQTLPMTVDGLRHAYYFNINVPVSTTGTDVPFQICALMLGGQEKVVVEATYTNTTATEPTPAPVTEYAVSIVAGGKGTGEILDTATSTAFSSANYEAGETVTLTANPKMTATGLACVCTNITVVDASGIAVDATITKTVTGFVSGVSFTMPEGAVTVTATFHVLGDINLNGGINGIDLAQLKKYTANPAASTLSADAITAANVAGTSNTVINGIDLAQLKRLAANPSSVKLPNGDYTD